MSAKASFRRIDYSLRPAKHAERRMLCDIFRRFSAFGPIEDYAYIGFGSVWFSDFSLFHRSLGIKKMLSIETETSAQERIEDNKPFQITTDFRHSTEALPDLDWNRNQFLWLDYDDPITVDMLLDMRTVAHRAKSGTALAVSVQCSQARQIGDARQDTSPDAPSALQRFIDEFSRERIAGDTAEDQLTGWSFGKLSRLLLLQEIESELATKNANSSDSKIIFTPICEIEYEDGAKMTTIVGIFHSRQDESKVQACNFDTLEFIEKPAKPIRINIPKLTSREFKKLESQLPLQEEVQLNLGSIPESEAKSFIQMYRYLPNFAVLEG